MNEDHGLVSRIGGGEKVRISWSVENMSNGHVNSDCVFYVPLSELQHLSDPDFDLVDTVSDHIRHNIFDILLGDDNE